MNMQRQTRLWAFVAASVGFGCNGEQPASAAADPALIALEAKGLPADTVRRTYADFGGKIALLGYELGTTGPVKAGDELGLTLYWQASAPLEPGWELTAEVLSRGAVLATQVTGALHGGADSKLGPAGFRLGRLYKDELKIKLPEALRHPEISIVASVKRSLPQENPERTAPEFRLPVLSGSSDGNHRAVVAHLPAIVTEKAAPAAKERQRRSRRRDGAPAPSAR
jgi:hypothetical protein